MGTSIQQNVSETVLDLVFGVAGAASLLLLMVAIGGFVAISGSNARSEQA